MGGGRTRALRLVLKCFFLIEDEEVAESETDKDEESKDKSIIEGEITTEQVSWYHVSNAYKIFLVF